MMPSVPLFYSFVTDEPTEDAEQAKLTTGVIVIEGEETPDGSSFSQFCSQSVPSVNMRAGVARDDVKIVSARDENGHDHAIYFNRS